MLTGKMVRARLQGNRVVALYLDVKKPELIETADRLLDIFRSQQGRSRGELEEDLRETFDNSPTQLIVNGLTKLLEDRCEFETVSGHPPAELRDAVFARAAVLRKCLVDANGARPPFERDVVLREVAAGFGTSPEVVEHGLFADLKSDQRMVKFADTTAGRLLQRYNVALAQAILLRSTCMKVHIHNEPPQRYRQLFHLVKFHRLICEAEVKSADSYVLSLDGPLSLFSATQKYGLQLALFLPAVLKCTDFELRADLRWGPNRMAKTFTVTPADNLVSHQPDRGAYVPPELAMFVELFKKRVEEWEVVVETALLPLGPGFWVPDFRLVRKADGKVVYMEVLGFWRRSSVEKHLQRLRQHAKHRFLLAVSDQLKVDDAELASLPAEVYRFRQMPLPDEVAKLAELVAG
jgi:predicted nuclease of restriction endonuclease-like RecB superfamily